MEREKGFRFSCRIVFNSVACTVTTAVTYILVVVCMVAVWCPFRINGSIVGISPRRFLFKVTEPVTVVIEHGASRIAFIRQGPRLAAVPVNVYFSVIDTVCSHIFSCTGFRALIEIHAGLTDCFPVTVVYK